VARLMCPRCKVRTKTSVGYCKPCNNARMKEYRESRKAKFQSGELRHPTRKRCRLCGVVKSSDHFSASYQVADGLHNDCKPCLSRLTNGINKKTRYGLSEEDIARRLEEQRSQCAICEQLFDVERKRAFHIDHDHRTGAVRGLLCKTCNLALGMLGDDAGRIALAIEYVRRTS